ncbi:putative GGDEF domain protein [Escherichia coli]|nr:putative GGDEF domain protein [Escherichia coli]STQ55151.1 putative GGDEF domain protein [Escherichia coli]
MHVQPISTFRLFQEGHLLRNSIAIFALTTLFYFIGAELRLVHELSLFWPLNGVMAGGLPAMSGLIDCITMRSVMWQCWFMMP